jgi:hypothetical protein
MGFVVSNSANVYTLFGKNNTFDVFFMEVKKNDEIGTKKNRLMEGQLFSVGK